jgi:ElaA protein
MRAMTIRCVRGDELTAQDVYDIWRIRDAVFAVEQQVEDEDADGLDLLATTSHLWLADADGITTYLRVIDDRGTRRVGRVCTRRDQRGRGLSGQLMGEVHRRWGDEPLELNAQAYLEGWYESFGYRRSGDDFDDAGILHVPMTREPA